MGTDVLIEEAFKSLRRKTREDRIRKVAAENPDLSLDLLAERFGMHRKTIAGIIGGRGRPDGFYKHARRCGAPDYVIPGSGRRVK